MRTVFLLVAFTLMSGCAGPQIESPAYRDNYDQATLNVKEGLSSGHCAVTRTCGPISYVDCGAAVDGPAYYVQQSTGRVLEVCGGACMKGPHDGYCMACPPPEWTCQ